MILRREATERQRSTTNHFIEFTAKIPEVAKTEFAYENTIGLQIISLWKTHEKPVLLI